MNQKLRSPLVSRVVSAICLFLFCFSQILPIHATVSSWPTVWSFESLENSSSEWWQSLRVQSVPGVIYHLQESSTLGADSWNTLETFYGSSGEWICPLFRGSAPVAAPSGQPVIPHLSGTPIRLAYLGIERTTTGVTLVSWNSLDDHSPKRMPLPGVTLDPVWDEFDAPYFNQHGNYYFALSPRLHSPVNFTATAVTLGTLDAAMIAAFTSHLADITANITNSIAMAGYYSQHPVPAGERRFYRIAADWSVDSDGDGRYDWQEIIFDGNNPFAADTDGDGTPDQAGPGGSGGTSSGYPAPTDAEGPTPLATVEQQTIVVARDYASNVERNDGISVYPQYAVTGISDLSQFEGCGSYAALKGEVDSLAPPALFGWGGMETFTCENDYESFGDGEHYTRYQCGRAKFRLRLDQPAPAGGYHIPVRVGLVYQEVSFTDGTAASVVTSRSAQEPDHIDITLDCAEGQVLGPVVEIEGPASLAQNRRVSYIPAAISTLKPDLPQSGPQLGGNHGPVFENGACVTSDEPFVVDFGNPSPGLIPDFNGTLEVFWQKRKFKNATELEDWSTIFQPNPNDPLTPLALSGVHSSVRDLTAGIYQLRAVLVLPDATQIGFPFVRMRNSKSMKNSEGDANPLLFAGQPDYFGICASPLSKAVRDNALVWLGATGYAKNKVVPIDPGYLFNVGTGGSPKCNIFVTHMANQAGATTPFFYRRQWGFPTPFVSAPIAKFDWNQNPEDNIDLDPSGWHYLGNATFPATDPSVEDFSSGNNSLRDWEGGPCPGMVCSSPRTSGGPRYGHVGIMDYDGSWINAGSKTVNKSLHLLDTLPDYKPNTFRSR